MFRPVILLIKRTGTERPASQLSMSPLTQCHNETCAPSDHRVNGERVAAEFVVAVLF